MPNHWLKDRNIFSDWLTDHQTETTSFASLDWQGPIATHPLFFGETLHVMGWMAFGLAPVLLSRWTGDEFDALDLIDPLATEDFDPFLVEGPANPLDLIGSAEERR